MAIELRELKGKDLFPVLTILGKLDVKDDFVKLFKGEDQPKKQPADKKKKAPTKAEKEELEKQIEERGILIVADLVQRVLLNIEKVEDDINRLLARLGGVSKEEIDDLSLDEYAGLLKSFFTKPELKDFFRQLASFTK